MTPAFVAAKEGRVEFIRKLASLLPKRSFSELDEIDNSLFHYAAMKNNETVKVADPYYYFLMIYCKLIFLRLYGIMVALTT